jgi:hypothetical protein
MKSQVQGAGANGRTWRVAAPVLSIDALESEEFKAGRTGLRADELEVLVLSRLHRVGSRGVRFSTT